MAGKLSVNPAVNEYIFSIIGKDEAGKGDESAPPFICCAKDTVDF